ncbi:VOC family protein [Acerihabitans arboris]|uniref:VOC family protein n=1 Tax=Acerihabitans arboris TaxID=2691583 RepID=A0A845SJI1_9GAMM|nr:VOC family protein [Acerihabitans arboris]NDL63417.1 VOC family protein [Acerihabitans arboris]
MTIPLDHLVINTHFATDRTADHFRALGFTLTPRGYHSLGSINHLLMFAESYLEIVGLPADGGRLRQELLDSPAGIDGLVFATADARDTARGLADAGFALQPVQDFSREVVSGNESGLARFTTVRLARGEFPAGRVYFCQHHTPEWVWRPEWLSHENQVGGLAGLTIISDDVETCGRHYRRLGDTDPHFSLDIVDYPAFARRFDGLPLPPPGREMFAAVHFQGGDLMRIARGAEAQELPLRWFAGRLQVALPELTTLLEFLP